MSDIEKSGRKIEMNRRTFAKLGVGAAAAMGAASLARAQSPASALESEFVMELLLDVAEQIDTGHTRIAPVMGGTFSGPVLNGTVLPGGADWIARVSGHTALDVRITLETDDGAHIYMTYRGIVHNGENGLYWRVTPLFSTTSEEYDWVNHIICVGKSKQVEGKVAYDIFRIL